jgi:predicted  nucleic acid-binding Zn-ribbon protein
MQVTESMRRDIHVKNEKIAKLEDAIEAQKARYEAELLALRQKLEGNAADHQMQAQHMEANFQDQMESLTQKLKVRQIAPVCIFWYATEYGVANVCSFLMHQLPGLG